MRKKKITVIGWVIIVLVAIGGIAGSYAIRCHNEKLIMRGVARALYRYNQLLLKYIEKNKKKHEYEIERI